MNVCVYKIKLVLVCVCHSQVIPFFIFYFVFQHWLALDNVRLDVVRPADVMETCGNL